MSLSLDKTPVMIFSKQLVRIKYIQHIQNDLKAINFFHDNKLDKLESKLIFLSQSYIIHLVGSWQVFVESLVQYCFDELVKRNPESELNTIAANRIDLLLKRFNTPNKENIDKIFKEGFGIDKVSSSWACDGVSRDDAIKIIENLLMTRHSIAHTAKAETTVGYESNFEIMNVVYKIACNTETYVLSKIRKA